MFAAQLPLFLSYRRPEMNSSPPDNEMSSHRLNEINMTKDADRDAELAKNATNVNLYEHDSAMDGLSLLEQKSVLIERALNETGFGKYQWAIFFLCTFRRSARRRTCTAESRDTSIH